MNFIITLLILLFILGFIVAFHEFGHFICAKKSGVFVDEFSIGMGPKIFSFKRKNKKDQTTYTLRALPIGGYVAMAMEEADGFKAKKNELLSSKPFIKQFLVLIMGIVFNFILAYVILFFNGIIWGCPTNKPYIGDVQEGSAAYEQGLESGDLIIEINNSKISNWDDAVLEFTYKVESNDYTFVIVKEDGQIVEKIITPKIITNENGDTQKVFGINMKNDKEYGFVNAIKYSIQTVHTATTGIFKIIGKLFSGKLSVSNLSGPVGMYGIIDKVKTQGLETLLYLLAYLSVNVGVMNLLPVPVFDGGRILILIIEKLRRKPLPEKFAMLLNYIGFGMLVILMLFVTLNDIIKLF